MGSVGRGKESMRNPDEMKSVASRDAANAARERLRALTMEAERRRKAGGAIAPRGHGLKPLPLSYAQERLWFLDQIGLAKTAYNVPLVLKLSGELAEGALESSFIALAQRHEILRTRLLASDGVPHQVIDESPRFKFRRVTLDPAAADNARELQALLRAEQQHHFDLAKEHPLRVLLATSGPAQHILSIVLHHVAVDGWSLSVLLEDVASLYTAFVGGAPDPLAALPLQYADYALWQRQSLQGIRREQEVDYWRETLKGAVTELQLPTDRPRPAEESFRGAEVTFRLGATLYARIK
jgi:hypothetical protein